MGRLISRKPIYVRHFLYILSVFLVTLWASGNAFAVVPVCTGKIGDFVWHDLNSNGTQDDGDAGINGVTVLLKDAGGNLIATTTTLTGPDDKPGYYQFTDLCAGDYIVTVDPDSAPLTGLAPTINRSTDGDDLNETDSNEPAGTSVSLPNNNTSNQTIDFGFVSLCEGSIGDFVWYDLDRDGFQDVGEPGIEGVVVRLKDADGNEIATTTTSADGIYLFSGLCPGAYTVVVDQSTLPPGFTPTTPCSNDLSIPIDSNANETGTCQPVQDVSLTYENPDNLTIDFGFVSPCSLSVDKKCLVAAPPPGPFVCSDAKPIDSLTMIWGGSAPIRIKAWKGAVGSTLLADIDAIAPGDEVFVSGYAGSPNDVYWEIFEAGTEAKVGESTFHVSCSDEDMNGPEDCGEYEGDGKAKIGFINDWIFEGMAGSGLALDCTPAPIAGADECSFETPPPPDCLTFGKPKSLTFRYTGADCSASSNNQASDKWTCTGLPGNDPVSISIVKDLSKIYVHPMSGIAVGDLVTISAIGADMGAEVQLWVGGQFLKFHTSCSQPLAAGDVFGSLELLQFNGQGADAEVTYFYEITNDSDYASVEVSDVWDDQLGELLEAPLTLAPRQSMTLEKSAFISATTTNTVTVTGGAGSCSATDSVTVTVTEPTCNIAAKFEKLEADKIKFKLTNAGKIAATLETLTVDFPLNFVTIKEVKLDGAIFKAGESALTVGPGVVITEADWTNSDVTKRQLDPGETRTLEIIFSKKAKVKWSGHVGLTTFREGCGIELVKP